MSRIEKFKTVAYNFSLESKQKFKHSCIITKNSKIITYGVNQGMRTKCFNNLRSCVHAEIDAAHKLIKLLKRKHGKNYKNYISKYMLWVVRTPNYKHSNVQVLDSKPCYYCTKDLLNIGFEKIGYSTENNDFIVEKLCKLINENPHKSNLQKRTEKHFT